MSATVPGAASETLSARVHAFIDNLMDAAGRLVAKVNSGVIAADAELSEHPEFISELHALEAIMPPEVSGAVNIAGHLVDAVAELTAHADSVSKAVAGASATVAGAAA
jgi:hypothetical protein